MSGELEVYVIYHDPADHPGQYVVRRWVGLTPHEHVAIASTLDEARAAIPTGLYPIARSDTDDPVIVESWV